MFWLLDFEEKTAYRWIITTDINILQGYLSERALSFLLINI